MTLKDLTDAIMQHDEGYAEMAVHFRLATHGEVDEENTHPFPLGEGAFMHNGIISFPYYREQYRSDSRVLVEDVLVPLFAQYPDFGSKVHEMLVLESLVDGSRGIILMPDRHLIIGEKQGLWDTECWFSNTTYRQPRISLTSPSRIGYEVNGYGSDDEWMSTGLDDDWPHNWKLGGEEDEELEGDEKDEELEADEDARTTMPAYRPVKSTTRYYRRRGHRGGRY